MIFLQKFFLAFLKSLRFKENSKLEQISFNKYK